ncbi:cation efflux family protein [Xylariales sp. AK1849]|nr:cation efflux family protein [Xylariales sp. AK1849]
MALPKITSTQKLTAIIAISFAFFVAEIAVGFKTGSLALVADAFHYLNDLIGFIVALAAILVSQKAISPKEFSFGWARASLLGAFFNGVFLLALGISIFLQSIERFVSIQHVENPELVLIMGCIGLTLNILSATLLHEHHGHDHGHDHGHGHGHSHSHSHDHDHEHPIEEHAYEESREHSHSHNHSHRPVNIDMGLVSTESADQTPMTPISAHAEHRHNIANLSKPGRDLGMLGAFVHVIGDALNNIGVIIAALVIWLTTYDARFYADPGVSMGIAIMILLSSLPLVKNSGKILMQSAPRGVNSDDVKHDLERIPGIESVHELHIWRLDQKKSIASAHVVVSNDNMTDFMDSAKTIKECLHAYGIHSATLQPELAMTPPPTSYTDTTVAPAGTAPSIAASSIRRRRADGTAATTCQIVCGNLCENLTCCAAPKPL